MALLSDVQRQALAASHPDWEIGERSVSRVFELDGFVGALGFVVKVGLLAQRANHHPDIDIRWNKVTLTLSTHSEGGLTEKDVDLVEKIEALF